MRTGALVGATLALALPLVEATVLPPGFEEQDVVCLSPGDPAQLAWAPDGDLFVGAKYGKVWLWSAGAAREVAFLAVSNEIERGLNGLAVDPDYLTNRHVWIYRTTTAPVRNRLSRFTFDGTSLVDETILLDGPLLANENHIGGEIRFAADGTLFVAMGNDDQDSTSQNPFELRGKILRLERDGSGAPGNPFADGASGDPRVWALGLRNPYRFAIDPRSGDLLIADVGWFLWEELHRGIAGANYGWPAVDGPSPMGVAGYVYPVHAYSHEGGGAAIIGGDFAEPGDFAPEYEGNYFFGDFVRRELVRVRFDARGNPASVTLWATDVPRPTDIEFGPDGALYYVSFGGGGIPVGCVKRIALASAVNRQPIAVASATPASGLAPLAVTLDGSASSDPDVDPLGYSWAPGDGSTATEAIAHPVYAPGVYFADLTVADGNGGSDRSPVIRIVSGNRRPAAVIASPADGTPYVAGETIQYLGSAIDPEEGPVPCERMTWQVVRHHGTHAHPVVGPLQGTCTGTFTIPDRGESAVDVRYEVVLSAADSGAPLGADGVLAGEGAVSLHPTTAVLTLETEPVADLALTLDDVAILAPYVEPSVIGFLRQVGAPDDQPRNGHTYRWLSWSDGGARVHEVRTPSAAATWVARFGCNVLAEVTDLRLTKDAGGGIELSWAPLVAPCMASGPSRYRVYGAPSPRPTASPGMFPVDPPFVLLGASADERFVDPASAGDQHYLVVAEGTDLRPGPSGHYGPPSGP